MGVTYPFLSEYIYSVTGCAFLAGVVYSIKSLTCVFFLVLGGSLADDIGRKKPLYVGTALLGLSQLMYGLAGDFTGFVLAGICEGVSYFYFPAFNAMIMDSAGSGRLVNLFTLALIADHLPYAVTPILGGFLRDFYGVIGLRFGFIFSGVAIVLVGLARRSFLAETVSGAKGFDARVLLKAYASVVKDFLGLRSLVKRLVLLRSFILLPAISMFSYYAVLYAVRHTGSVSFTGWGLIIALSSASLLAAPPLANIVGKFKPAFTYPFLVLLEGLASLTFLLNSWLAFLASMLLLNICGALTYAVERAIVSIVTEQTMRGRAEGFMNISYYLGAALGSLVGGYVYPLHPPALMVLTSTILAVGAFTGFALLKNLPRVV